MRNGIEIILSFSAPHRQDPALHPQRELEARQQFAEAGITLSDQSCRMVWGGNEPDKVLNHTVNSLRNVAERFQDGDLVYLDHEPHGFAHTRGFDDSIGLTQEGLLMMAKHRFGHEAVSMYGLPFSSWWKPWSTRHAVEGLDTLHRREPLGWFAGQMYQSYNLGEKHGLDNLSRVLTMRQICNAIDPTRACIPFVQDTIRHPENDRAPMTDETIFDLWASLASGGVTRVVFWFESGGDNQHADAHAAQLIRHGQIMPEAIASGMPTVREED